MMRRSLHAALAIGLLALTQWGCYGLEAGSRYPDYSSSDVSKGVLSPENDDGPSVSLGNFVISDAVCEGIDTHAQTQPIAQDDLSRFLARTGAPPIEVKARGNLYWFDFPGTDPEDGDVVRLRLAVLADAKDAAIDLHEALLQHGPGWWGMRRHNLSILAPKAGTKEAIAFALKYKLPCWGMVSMAGLDDVYVVPGPYMEL